MYENKILNSMFSFKTANVVEFKYYYLFNKIIQINLNSNLLHSNNHLQLFKII